jgi:hypothetical protein
VGAAALAVGRRAKAHGILAPVLVGVALRLVVMLIAHVGSLELGDHGILFIDDETFRRGATHLAALWRDGQVPDPTTPEVLGTYQFGYQLFLATIFTLGTSSVLLGKLANVLLGGLTVYLVGRIGGRLLGDGAKVRAAWLAALAPTMIWWSAPMVKEALATALLAGGVLAVTYFPQPRAVVALAAITAPLMFVRGAAALALVVGAGVAVVLAGHQAERKWITRPVALFGVVLLGTGVLMVLVASRGRISSFFDQYGTVIHRMFDLYQGGDISRAPLDVPKSFVTPLPWTFDSATRNWDRGLYAGIWLLLCAYPLAVAGVWRLRRWPETWLLATTVLTAATFNALTSGFVFRQRSMIEPLILVLALAGARSWQMAARTASAALAVVVVAAGVQSGSPAVVALVAAAAGAMLLLSRRLPSRPFEAPPESRMVAAFRQSAELRGAGTPGRPLSRVATRAAGARKAVLRVAPRLALARSQEQEQES